MEPFTKFYDETIESMNQKRLPDYDGLYKMFDDILYEGKSHKERIVFEWLTEEEKIKAMTTIPPSIESIVFSI